MRRHNPFGWRYLAGHLIALLMVQTAIGLATAQAGVLVPVPEALSMPSVLPAPIQATPAQAPVMQAAPVKAQPLQRIDEQSDLIASEIDSLTSLADRASHPNRFSSKSKPKGGVAPGNAAWMLGLIYLHGAGVRQDQALAQIWFDRALGLGAKQALAGLAWCAIEGCRGLPTPAQANEWITPLRSINRPRAQYLEWLANEKMAPLRTITPDLKSREVEAARPVDKLLLSAARSGDIHALIELGLIAMTNEQPAKALKYFQEAAPRSEVAASNAAIVAEQIQQRVAPQAESNKAATELLVEARRFHRGEGRPVNYGEAIRLYRLAAEKGSQEATRMLSLIYSKPLVRGGFDIAWISQLGELDLSRDAPSLRSRSSVRQLQRERTALVDLLPAKWRQRIP